MMLNCGKFTKFDLAAKLGISRPTLDRRLKNNDWKVTEMVFIKSL
jgi:hypothetical protein